ncbi:MAG: hypothetical protein CL461_01200 [Acidimicrobiaceae bacterium]|nr:hypothetical protein [Acidimicrobiaceae bacterium]
MVIKKVENKIEKLVEGTFAKFFSSELKPVEISRKIVREIELNRSIGVHGDHLAPNDFDVAISESDYSNLIKAKEPLEQDLEETIRDYSYQEGYIFLGSINVSIKKEDNLRAGTFRIDARLKQDESGCPPGALVLPDGKRIQIGNRVITIGRLQDSTVCIDDPSISRNQAEVLLRETGYLLSDLGSTNGTLVNGRRISQHVLTDHDQIEFGSYRIRFEAS